MKYPILNYIIEAIVTKTVWYWHKDEHVDQWNIAEDLKISTHSDSQLIFDKSDKTHIEKDTLFSNRFWET